MTIGRIRDSMAFHEEFTAEYGRGKRIILRLYVTNRSGIYGHQFAACLWYTEPGVSFDFGSARTGGCGYAKDNHAAAQAFQALADYLGKKAPKLPLQSDGKPYRNWHAYAEGYGARSTLKVWAKKEPHRAHG